MKNITTLLQLNSSEEYVLEQLKKKTGETSEPGLLLSDIAEVSGLPRMTCHDAVKSLCDRGLLRTQKIGKRKHYSISAVDDLVDTIRKDLATTPTSSETSRTIEGGITLYSGIANCHAIWRKIGELNRGERVILLQPNKSIAESLHKMGIRSLYPSNDALNSKGIIVEGLVHKNCYEEIFKILEKGGGYDFALQEIDKFSRRTSDISLMDTSYLKIPTEMIFMRNTAYIINWKDIVAVEIKNTVIRDFLYELYVLARGYGKKVNQAEHTRKLAEKIRLEHQ